MEENMFRDAMGIPPIYIIYFRLSKMTSESTVEMGMSTEDATEELPQVDHTIRLISDMTAMQHHYDKMIADLQNEIYSLTAELEHTQESCPQCEVWKNSTEILRQELARHQRNVRADLVQVLDEHSFFRRLFSR